MYKEDMGLKIKYLRKNVCGYSQRKLAKLVNEDIETIKMIESGELKNPDPKLILRIAEMLDSFYMEFVNVDAEDDFIYYLDWGTDDHCSIIGMKNFTLALSEALINIKVLLK